MVSYTRSPCSCARAGLAHSPAAPLASSALKVRSRWRTLGRACHALAPGQVAHTKNPFCQQGRRGRLPEEPPPRKVIESSAIASGYPGSGATRPGRVASALAFPGPMPQWRYENLLLPYSGGTAPESNRLPHFAIAIWLSERPHPSEVGGGCQAWRAARRPRFRSHPDSGRCGCARNSLLELEAWVAEVERAEDFMVVGLLAWAGPRGPRCKTQQ
jgi:hypothetical protein